MDLCYNESMKPVHGTGLAPGKGGLHMKLNIMAKKIQVGPSFSDYAKKKLDQKLDKFFEDEAEAKITLTEQRGQIVVELTVRAGSMIYRAEQSAVDKNDALDAAIEKIIRKIRRNKTKLGKRIKEGALSADSFTDSVEEQTEYNVIRRKQFRLHPMTVDEAILQMNMLGHSFFLFMNAENGSINVVYRREDGDYAVLEPTTE